MSNHAAPAPAPAPAPATAPGQPRGQTHGSAPAPVINPTRLDVAVFARLGSRWQASLPLAACRRLLADADPANVPDAATQVHVEADGQSEARPGGERHRLHLQAATSMTMVCQRCLGPVEIPLAVDRNFVFAPDEASAAALDAELDDDVLVETYPFDLTALVEDELLLAMPLVPMHDVCPVPLPSPGSDGGVDSDAPAHPFAALAALKKTG